MNTMVSGQKLANAFGGKSARACDNCVKKRARWYCAADDAFLCQLCDSSVHSANPLAQRHERVRLKTASFKAFDNTETKSMPTWHKGFTKKPRTPRQKNPEKSISDENVAKINNPFSFVPEICSEENSHEENDDQLLYYRVPIFDPFVDELCTNSANNDEIKHGFDCQSKPDFSQDMNNLGFLPSEMDLAEFAADVESLLGKGLEDESFDMEGLGLLDCDENEKEFNKKCNSLDERSVKVEDDGELIDMGKETFEINFDYDSPVTCEEEDNKEQIMEPVMMNNFGDDHNKGYGSKKILLRLDYEGVMSAWDDQKSPWMNGERPEIDAGDCWPDYMGSCGAIHAYGDMGLMSGHSAAMADGGREARVSRYREKRRTRLFSKKIRYEVRKLNAEKRPRMKGRFVKRTNFVSPLCSISK